MKTIIKKTRKEQLAGRIAGYNRQIRSYEKELTEVKSWPLTSFSGIFGTKEQRIAHCICSIRALKNMRARSARELMSTEA